MVLIHRQLPYPHWEFTPPGREDQLRLVPERGGLVTGWRCQGQELLYLDQDRFENVSLSVRGGIPVLFPICGGLPPHTLPLPQHGFARDCSWDLAPLADSAGVALHLRDSEATRSIFPYAFSLILEFRLPPSSLEIKARLSNLGDEPLPCSLGLHPYFCVSSLEGVQVSGLPPTCIDQVSNTTVSTSEQLQRLPLGVDLLAEPSTAVALQDPQAGRTLRLETSSPLDLVVIWTDPPRPMVCLEPWTAPRGALLSGDRLLTLAPGETQELSCRYLLEQT
jgi:galactose mutarotase-like enzyme